MMLTRSRRHERAEERLIGVNQRNGTDSSVELERDMKTLVPRLICAQIGAASKLHHLFNQFSMAASRLYLAEHSD
jgi:hypothetical protein